MTVIGVVEKIDNIFTRNKKSFTRVKFHDESGTIEIVWFNQPYLAKSITKRYVFEHLREGRSVLRKAGFYFTGIRNHKITE